jgi:hypothetical protein
MIRTQLGRVFDGEKGLAMRRVLLTAVASVGLAIGLAAPAYATSPSEAQCEASGGTFERTNGEVTCTTHVGNSDNSQTVDEGGQGNLSNKATCSGPGNSTAKCP